MLLTGRSGRPAGLTDYWSPRCDEKVRNPVRSKHYYWVTPHTTCDRPSGHDGEHRNRVTRTVWGDRQAIASGS